MPISAAASAFRCDQDMPDPPASTGLWRDGREDVARVDWDVRLIFEPGRMMIVANAGVLLSRVIQA